MKWLIVLLAIALFGCETRVEKRTGKAETSATVLSNFKGCNGAAEMKIFTVNDYHSKGCWSPWKGSARRTKTAWTRMGDASCARFFLIWRWTMAEKTMAIMRGVGIGMRDCSEPVLWFAAHISKGVASLQVFDWAQAAEIIKAYAVHDVRDLEGKACWIQTKGKSGGRAVWAGPCVIK